MEVKNSKEQKRVIWHDKVPGSDVKVVVSLIKVGLDKIFQLYLTGQYWHNLILKLPNFNN